ncbi:MAG: site-specific integrase, partial [Thaumarchaeota archaeon]|nr:site-specific integrase [Nitrososphaerota archaeon]
MVEKDNDIYNSAKNLETIKKRISTSFPNENGNIATAFLDALRANGISPVRATSLGWCVFNVLGMMDKNLKDLERKDIELIVKKMQQKTWGSETRKVFVFTVKRLVSYAKQDIIVDLQEEQQYSPEVAWLHPRKYMKKNENSTLEHRKGFSEEEIEKMLLVLPEVAQDQERDHLFILLTYESGARVGETIQLRLRDIEIDEKYNTAFLLFKSSGKSTPRKVPIILSYRRLVDYMAKHPLRTNPESFLFYSNRAAQNKISYTHISHLIRKLCAKAEIRYRSVYKLRHSRAQNLLSSSTAINTVSKLLGHSNLKTTAVYLSAMDSDVIKAVRKERGLAVEDDKETKKLELKTCPKCKRAEDPLADRCGACGTFLTQAVALRYEKARESYEKKKDSVLAKSVTDLQKMVHDQGKIIQQLL